MYSLCRTPRQPALAVNVCTWALGSEAHRFEPDDEILEVGIASLKAALNGSKQTQAELDEVFFAAHPDLPRDIGEKPTNTKDDGKNDDGKA